ncbi:MAG: peroxiredoxin family protein [Chloroflexota bacterium]|nr:peroxiredoxin family protein [Chloroflexota bacterium]
MADLALWLLVAVMGVGLVALWAFVFQLVRQQGRVLLRIDRLEDRLQAAGIEGFSTNGAYARPEGLPVGAQFPDFRLPTSTGESIGLEDYRGRRLLLVSWGQNCGFCKMIAPDLAKRQDRLRKKNTELVIAGYDDPETNRRLREEHGLSVPILQQTVDDRLEPFREVGTPAAYLLDEAGRVAAPLALGAQEVPALAREAAGRGRRLRRQKEVSESRIERNGLRAGTAAPGFTLPSVNGGRVSLEQYRGRRALLVFSDPQCGPCDELAAELSGVHRELADDDVALVMVSRGDADENRRKCEQYGFQFPVAVQRGWQVSKKYGIFATPVAFLIDEEGVTVEDVAIGAEAILALAQRAAGAGKGAPIEV